MFCANILQQFNNINFYKKNFIPNQNIAFLFQYYSQNFIYVRVKFFGRRILKKNVINVNKYIFKS